MIPRTISLAQRHGRRAFVSNTHCSSTVIIVRTLASAIDKVAENQIAAWLRNKGDENLPHGKKLTHDVHKAPAQSLGLENDHVHSKILADNNIRPESVQRRLDLDAAWGKCAEEIRKEFLKQGSQI